MPPAAILLDADLYAKHLASVVAFTIAGFLSVTRVWCS